VFSDPTGLRVRRFDQVWLCVPTTALTDGSLDPLLAAVRAGPSSAASVVCLQPGTFVKAHLAERVPEPQIVFGVIGMQSYHAPLEGSSASYEEATGPGTAYFLPPINPCAFSGVGDRANAVVDALRMGGGPARVVGDAWIEMGLSTALLMPPIAGIELVGWSLEKFRRSPEAALAATGAREAVAIAAEELGQPLPPYLPLVRPALMRLVFGLLGPMLAPLDLEAFFRAHFGKVGAQTRELFDDYLRDGASRGLSVDALRELRERLGDARRQ
jgi:2-dehydropantoate 2-reductase